MEAGFPMDVGILAVFVLDVFVLELTGICVTMYLYLWVKIVAGSGFAQGQAWRVMETLNLRPTARSSNLKM